MASGFKPPYNRRSCYNYKIWRRKVPILKRCHDLEGRVWISRGTCGNYGGSSCPRTEYPALICPSYFQSAERGMLLAEGEGRGIVTWLHAKQPDSYWRLLLPSAVASSQISIKHSKRDQAMYPTIVNLSPRTASRSSFR